MATNQIYERKIQRLVKEKKHAWHQYYNLQRTLFEERQQIVQAATAPPDDPEKQAGALELLRRVLEETKHKLECPICLETIPSVREMSVTNCGHHMCSECWTELKRRNRVVKCPQCREEQG